MAEQSQRFQSSLDPDQVMVRAVHFFTNAKWRAGSQSQRIATFVGRPPIPVFLILLTILGYIICLVPVKIANQ